MEHQDWRDVGCPPIAERDGGEPLPLAAASARLRGKPGRPTLGDVRPGRPAIATSGHGAAGRQRAAVVPIPPRVLDLHAAAAYLGLRERKVRELARSGILPRVRIPLPHDGEVRKLLFDRADLDRLVDTWKERLERGDA